MMDIRRHEDEVVEPDEMGSREPMLEPADDHLDMSQASVPRRRWRRAVVGLCMLLVVAAPLGLGTWRHATQHREVMTTADQRRDFVPNVRVSAVKANNSIVVVSLPATTAAFSKADIFARASGYIEKREADIGDRVKEGQLLAEITAPELDQQIAQAEATLTQLRAALQQAQANLDLAQVTWNRDSPLVKEGWVTQQQGTIDVQTLKAQQAAVQVAEANVVAQQAQVNVLNQQKAYQRVVAPFDGVITQRNIDVGSLVSADAVSATFMFTIMQNNVIRTQVFVPQDQAFGLTPGVQAEVRVPEIPGRTFRGTVTRIADALQPGTRTLLTEVDIPNPDGTLTPGMYCTIELHIPRKTPSLLVPADAIIFNGDGLQVAVLENGTVHIRKVSVTRDLGTEVEVNDGVAQGDQVVLNPPVDLVDGGKAQVRTGGAVARRD
jgi:RND family efflux transporter MFP subunit